MATHPWSSTHTIMTEQDRLNASITEVCLDRFRSFFMKLFRIKYLTLEFSMQDLIRLSVGTEDVNDVINDIRQRLAAIPD